MATAVERRTLNPGELREPPLARFLFSDTRASVIWLVIRLYLGWQWLQAGYEKMTSPVWFGSTAGGALTGFVNGALKQTSGDHPNVQGWYADFLRGVVLPNANLFSNMVAVGETLVGIALILGALTGVAAFFGVLMNANYLLSGAVSTNPVLIILGALVMMAWRNAGWLGLDRWLLPLLGTPWQPGTAFRPGDRRRRDRRATERTADRRAGDRRGREAGLPEPAYDPTGAAAYQTGTGMRREAEYDTGAARGYGAPVETGADAVYSAGGHESAGPDVNAPEGPEATVAPVSNSDAAVREDAGTGGVAATRRVVADDTAPTGDGDTSL